jgi:hypothetical protein
MSVVIKIDHLLSAYRNVSRVAASCEESFMNRVIVSVELQTRVCGERGRTSVTRLVSGERCFYTVTVHHLNG